MGEYQTLIHTLALTMGVAWASGINLYAAVAVLGLAGNAGYVQLPDTLAIVEDPLVIIAACFMYCVEFFADKIPGVDSTWDALHTFIRIPAGAMLAAGAVGDVTPALAVAAGLRRRQRHRGDSRDESRHADADQHVAGTVQQLVCVDRRKTSRCSPVSGQRWRIPLYSSSSSSSSCWRYAGCCPKSGAVSKPCFAKSPRCSDGVRRIRRRCEPDGVCRVKKPNPRGAAASKRLILGNLLIVALPRASRSSRATCCISIN